MDIAELTIQIARAFVDQEDRIDLVEPLEDERFPLVFTSGRSGMICAELIKPGMTANEVRSLVQWDPVE